MGYEYKKGEYKKWWIIRMLNWPKKTIMSILNDGNKGYRFDVKAIGVFGYYIAFIDTRYKKD